MRTIYKLLSLNILLLLNLSSCQKDTSKDIKALNSFLNENYQIKAKVLKNQQEEYSIKVQEIPRTRNIKLDTVWIKYEALISKLTQNITSKNHSIETIQNEYHQLLNEIETIVQKEDGYTIDRLLTTNNTSQLDKEYHLRMMRNNLIIAMSYTFEYLNKPPSIIHDVSTIKHIETKVKQLDDRVLITLSSVKAQLVQKGRHLFIDQILLNDSKINIEPTIVKNVSFANIVLDSLQSGNYSIQGKIHINEEGKIIEIPFLQKFEVH